MFSVQRCYVNRSCYVCVVVAMIDEADQAVSCISIISSPHFAEDFICHIALAGPADSYAVLIETDITPQNIAIMPRCTVNCRHFLSVDQTFTKQTAWIENRLEYSRPTIQLKINKTQILTMIFG